MTNEPRRWRISVDNNAHAYPHPKHRAVQIISKFGRESTSSYYHWSIKTGILADSANLQTSSSNNAVDESLVALCTHTTEKAVNFINVEEPTKNFFEIRRLTNFTWTELATLLNVDRRSIFNWASGSRIRKSNKEHLANTLEVLRFTDSGSSENNGNRLKTLFPDMNTRPIDKIRSKKYEEAKILLGIGNADRNFNRKYASGSLAVGEFQPIWNHFEADGTEKIEPLPDEPRKPYQIRPIFTETESNR